MSPAFAGASMMFHIGLEMDAASGSATRQMAATLQRSLLTWISVESPKTRGTKGGKGRGNYRIFFENSLKDFSIKGGITDGGSGRRLNCSPAPNRVALLY
ncbi:hypothetical protein PILCRDRAFT_15735 [Piloderma croceum F 1598]|uniref:Uncharacterized protein n=1 Tax=Piloderma croceum (strain F 1598) TaxID=765440 RepID=A0A0C3EJN8_PILCF|nr:hypothetical protein PILCRDRAFT_15735 [Piloderma croceum F 1598]